MRAQRVQGLIDSLGDGLHGKEEALRLSILAAIAGENLFLYGPTGTGKSVIADRVALALGGARLFSQLLGRFSTPDEVFGPVSVRALKERDRFERVTEGYLPSAEVVFLDQVWNASTPILNTLLTAINERTFRNGADTMQLPLRTVIAAAVGPPSEDAALEQVWDRFLVRVAVPPVAGREGFEGLISAPVDRTRPADPPTEALGPDELDEWRDAIDGVTMPEDIAALLFDIRERIERHNRINEQDNPILISDRRWAHSAHLLRTSAFLNDRSEVDAIDCILLRFCLWSTFDQIEPVHTIIDEALRRYSASGGFDAEAYGEHVAEVIADVRVASGDDAEEAIEVPVVYRSEYYRVEDFVEDHLSLIWIGDVQNLSREEPIDADLFFYGDEDEYAYSERFRIRAVDDTTLEIDGETFSLETEAATRVRRLPRELSDSERRTLAARLEVVRDGIDERLARIAGYRDAATGAAASHLFVHREYARVLADGMDTSARAFGDLHQQVETALGELVAPR